MYIAYTEIYILTIVIKNLIKLNNNKCEFVKTHSRVNKLIFFGYTYPFLLLCRY